MTKWWSIYFVAISINHCCDWTEDILFFAHSTPDFAPLAPSNTWTKPEVSLVPRVRLNKTCRLNSATRFN